jgi:assimilatory nitrate reductase catalytic subunit
MSSVDPTLRATRTTCPYCGVGCGVLATPDGSGGAAISGDSEHPANFGRLCSKGSALGETLGLADRLLHPMIRCSKGNMERVAWSDALDHVAHRLAHIIKRDGPGAVAFYLSGQLLTEDYYVANKLMKGFIGSANVDTNSRLCMSSSVAGHRRAFGADTVPGCYEDLDQADLLVLVGSNAAWCHPVLFQRMLANKQARGARIVVIDPRRTDTAEDADLFLGLKPGTDTALFSGLLVHLADSGAVDHGYIDSHTGGFDEALARARGIAGGVGATALATGLAEQDVADFYRLFTHTPRVVTLYSQGVNQSAQGTDKVNAIINCHLATGRIGKPGASPFSLTGQPNAMGGREVGGLANQLAAHMGFTPPDIDRVRRFWKAPRIATHEGLKAVQLFEAIGRGEIKALWVMGTNPAVSLPNADAARAALKSGLRKRAFQRHRRVGRACAVAGAGLGREIRNRDQFGAAHFAPARVPRSAGESKTRLVDRQRGGKATRPRRGVHLQFGGRRVPRACRPVGVRE